MTENRAKQKPHKVSGDLLTAGWRGPWAALPFLGDTPGDRGTEGSEDPPTTRKRKKPTQERTLQLKPQKVELSSSPALERLHHANHRTTKIDIDTERSLHNKRQVKTESNARAVARREPTWSGLSSHLPPKPNRNGYFFFEKSQIASQSLRHCVATRKSQCIFGFVFGSSSPSLLCRSFQ